MQSIGDKMSSIKTFSTDKKVLKTLTDEEKRVVKILQEVVKDFALVYGKQKQDGFYPKGATKAEIETAAKKDPQILSPFTLVYKKGNELKAISYSEKYQDLLKPISKKIIKASKISSNKSFKKYLIARAKALLDGSYREADIAWLQVKHSTVDFSIGPFERYLDEMFFTKRAYQSHIGIIDSEVTETADKIKETLYSFAKISSDKKHSVEIPQKGVKVLVEHVPVFSGFLAESMFVAEHFPCDLDLMQKYGTLSIVYSSVVKLKFDRLYYPIFKTLFEKRFASKYSKELLLRAAFLNIRLQDLAKQLHKFEGSRERLKELYAPIDEANALASGIQHSKHLVVKGMISQELLEAIMIMHIVSMISVWTHAYRNHNGTIDSHMKGFAIDINCYIKSGALKEQNGIFWPSFSKIFFEIENLADKLSDILQKGTYVEAKKFIEDHADYNNLKKFSIQLKDLPLKI